MLDDRTFIAQFESQTLDPVYFDHRGHLRLAWIYLGQHNLHQAIRKTCSGIKAYANSLGAPNKFHHSLTEATVRLMAIYAGGTRAQDFDQFLKNCPDLVHNLPALLAQHYSSAILQSDLARQQFVAPDIAPFDLEKPEQLESA